MSRGLGSWSPLQLVLLICSWQTLHAFTSTQSFLSPNVLTPRTRPCRWSRGFASSPPASPSWIRHTWHSRAVYGSSSSLSAFLPPSGGDKKSELKELASTALTLLGVVAFFVSPLGAIVFTLFNSIVALLILIPLGGIVAFNVWQYFNTQTGVCPNCQSPVKVMKDESPSICFSCGSIVQLRDGQVYLANPNNDILNTNSGPSSDSIFASLFEQPTIVSDRATATEKKRSTTVIDVDAKRED